MEDAFSVSFILSWRETMSQQSFARELADVFEKNEKKNKTTSVYRLESAQN